MDKEKLSRHERHVQKTRKEMEDMDEFEKFMAMSWGTPKGIAIALASISGFLLSIGVFLWLLHVADIIK
ncbi:MAG TPA: hypothetical protein VMR16_03815 [Candidatus Saccharimonadales bacterium]|nr:hypothetical protein [Candidatus Saccharimonadales bacterium]